ncbi:MAG: hypothetical protein NVV74_20980 [Magnetospirillum sp.]|nr:hypothetical protein [Magnetospirillum sp.]
MTTRKFAPPPTKFGAPSPAQAKAAISPSRVHVPPPTRFAAPAAAQPKSPTVWPGHSPVPPPFGPAARPPVAPPRPGNGTIQAMLPSFVTSGHKDVKPYNTIGPSDLGLRLFGLPGGGGSNAGTLPALRIELPNFQSRGDKIFIEESIKNIESQALTVTRDLQNGGKSKAKQTEVIGEAAGVSSLLSSGTLKGFEMLMSADPGHGAGVDGFLGKPDGKGGMEEYIVLEAKGPGAGLSKGQLEEDWIVTRLDRLSRSNVPSSTKKYALDALDGINKKKIKKIGAVVVKAVWDAKNKRFTYRTTKKKLDRDELKRRLDILKKKVKKV